MHFTSIPQKHKTVSSQIFLECNYSAKNSLNWELIFLMIEVIIKQQRQLSTIEKGGAMNKKFNLSNA